MSREGYIAVVNGPNLNMLGRRQPGIYGTATLDDIVASLRAGFPQLDIRHECRQGEGELVELIQRFGTDPACCGIVLNAAAYTHTSLAVADAVAAVDVPVVEVHLSNIYAREAIRRTSLLSPVCAGCICGFGAAGYALAVRALLQRK